MDANLKNIKMAAGAKGIKLKWLREQMELSHNNFYYRCNHGFSKSEKFYMSYLLGVDFK